MKEEQVYLHHILDAIDQIAQYAGGNRQTFFASRMIQDAVVRNLEIIGEAVKNLPEEFRNQHPEILWTRIAGLRDVLIHKNFGVDLETV